MEHFYIYSFTLAVIPLLLGLLFIWFGKKLWDNATKKMRNISNVTPDVLLCV